MSFLESTDNIIIVERKTAGTFFNSPLAILNIGNFVPFLVS